MKYFIIGFILGTLITGGIAFAYMEITLQDARGNAIGTAANPLYIIGQ